MAIPGGDGLCRDWSDMSKQQTGFVIVMRGRVELSDRSHWQEWLIVARWGDGGEFLSVSRTCIRARGGPAPIGLKPRQTALARQVSMPSWRAKQSFLFVRRLPQGIRLAGEFVRIDGYLRLRCNASDLIGEGRCSAPNRRDWRLSATHVPWVGEFFETANANAALTMTSRTP